MNTTALTAVLALACSALAHATAETSAPQAPPTNKPSAADSSPTTPSKADAPDPSKKARKSAAAEDAMVERFVSLQDAAIATFLELGDTLRGVKDNASAEAAAPAVKVAGEQLYTIITAVEALGEPSEAAQQAIMTRVANVAEKNEVVENVMVPLLTLMMQEPPCYGSDTLQTELTNLLANLQGAAGIEEEELEEAEDTAPLQEPDADEPAESR